jgi:pseudouridine synthase
MSRGGILRRHPGGGRRRGAARRAHAAPGLKTLDRVLSKAGAGSRTQAQAWILSRRVRVDGKIVTDAGRWVDARRHRVTLDGREVRPAEKIYLLLHKPNGCVTTYRDPDGRPTVFDLLPRDTGHLFSVGRLDLDTSGLLLLTNDSRFAERIANPDYKVPKSYAVTASTPLDDGQLERLRCGILLKDGPTRPAEVRRLREAGGRTVFEITITEGRNRQVRRMVEAIGSGVLELARVAIGPIRIGGLPAGRSRPLTANEVRSLLGSPQRVSRRAGSGRASSRR